MEDEKNAEELDEKIRKLREEADRLETLIKEFDRTINESMGKMAMRGFVNALVFIPLLGLIVYAAARIALRKPRQPFRLAARCLRGVG